MENNGLKKNRGEESRKGPSGPGARARSKAGMSAALPDEWQRFAVICDRVQEVKIRTGLILEQLYEGKRQAAGFAKEFQQGQKRAVEFEQAVGGWKALGKRFTLEHNALKSSTHPNAPHHVYIASQAKLGVRVGFEMVCAAANAPGRLTPIPDVFLQRWRRPARQLRQRPQTTCPSPLTRSPGLKSWTLSPILSILPTNSCPMTIGTGIVFCAHASQL